MVHKYKIISDDIAMWFGIRNKIENNFDTDFKRPQTNTNIITSALRFYIAHPVSVAPFLINVAFILINVSPDFINIAAILINVVPVFTDHAPV